MRLFLIFCLLVNGFVVVASPGEKQDLPDKIIVLNVYETGIITDGRDTISTDDLAEYVRDRLFKNYTGTGKMYDKIKIQQQSVNIPATVMEVVLKEVKAGQKSALTDMCLHKYKKLFDTLGKKQQQKLQKQFPVLFQVTYS